MTKNNPFLRFFGLMAIFAAVFFVSPVSVTTARAADAPAAQAAPQDPAKVQPTPTADLTKTDQKVEAKTPDTGNAGANSLLTWLTPILVPLLIVGVKKVLPSLPGWTLPIIAPVLGIVIDLVNTATTSHAGNMGIAAALGLAGVGLREIKDQVHTAVDPDRATRTS